MKKKKISLRQKLVRELREARKNAEQRSQKQREWHLALRAPFVACPHCNFKYRAPLLDEHEQKCKKQAEQPTQKTAKIAPGTPERASKNNSGFNSQCRFCKDFIDSSLMGRHLDKCFSNPRNR